MEEVLILMVAVGVVTTLVAAVSAALYYIPQKKWSAMVDGHRVELVEYVNSNLLMVNGEEVARASGNGDILVWTLPSGKVVHGVINVGFMAFTKTGHILVDNALVAGAPWPTGLKLPGAMATGSPASPASPQHTAQTEATEPEPEDPRWKAAKTLVDSALALGGPQGGVLAELENQIRQRMLVIEHLSDTAEAYRVLNPDGGGDLAGPHEQILKALLDDLQSLHGTLATGATRPEAVDDDVGDLIENLRADLEVRRVDEELARKARLAHVRRTQAVSRLL